MPEPKPKRTWVEAPNKYGRFEYLEDRDGAIFHCSGYTEDSKKKARSENPIRDQLWYSKDKWDNYVKPALDRLKAMQYDPVPTPA